MDRSAVAAAQAAQTHQTSFSAHLLTAGLLHSDVDPSISTCTTFSYNVIISFVIKRNKFNPSTPIVTIWIKHPVIFDIRAL